jgi:hypothetical protein
MDDSLQDLERELQTLALRRPSAQLLERIERDLAGPAESAQAAQRPRYTTATNLTSWKWNRWRTASLAAALALAAVLGLVYSPKRVPSPGVLPGVANPASSSGSAAQYAPVAASNVLYDLKDEGLIKGEDGVPLRRVHYRYVDTYSWKSTKRNASLKWSMPRDEIRIIPASLN